VRTNPETFGREGSRPLPKCSVGKNMSLQSGSMVMGARSVSEESSGEMFDRAGPVVDISYARELLDAAKLDAVVASSPAHVVLLSGFGTWWERQLRDWMVDPSRGNAYHSGFALLDRRGSGALVVSPLFLEDAKHFWAQTVVAYTRLGDGNDDSVETLCGLLRSAGLESARIGVELDGAPDDLRARIVQLLPNALILDCSALLRLLRTKKSDLAVRQLQAVAQITEDALAEVRRIAPRVEEWEPPFRTAVAARGADFDHLVYGLPSGGVAATHPSRESSGGRLVYVDCGARKSHFFSDTGVSVSRSSCDRITKRRFSVAREVIDAGVNAMTPGVRSSNVYRAMQRTGKAEPCLRSHGHGLGLDVREFPLIRPLANGRIADETICVDSDLKLELGMVINLEVGGFFPDGSSLQLEETYLISADGTQPLVNQMRDQPWQLEPR